MAKLADLHDEYVAWRSTAKPSPLTVTAWRADVAGVSTYLADRVGAHSSGLTTDALTVANLRAAFSAFAQERSAATVRRAWSSWSTFCRYLTHEGLLPGNPMDGVAKPPPPRRQPKPLRGADSAERLVRTLTEAAGQSRDGEPDNSRTPWPQMHYAVIAVLLGCGLRSAEVIALRLRDVDGPRDARVLHVIGKGDKERSVPLEAGVEAAIDAYLASRALRYPREVTTPASPLFLARSGRPLTKGALAHLVRESYRQAGISGNVPAGANVHALRHTFGTEIVRGGASLSEAQRLLGHETPGPTAGYVDIAAEEVRGAVRASRLTRILDEA